MRVYLSLDKRYVVFVYVCVFVSIHCVYCFLLLQVPEISVSLSVHVVFGLP